MHNCQNVYQSARLGAGLTQESAAELLETSVRALQGYEQDGASPRPGMVARMVQVYRAPWLGNQYCNNCPLGAGRELPAAPCDMQQVSIEMALLCDDPMQFHHASRRLMEIVLDRTVSDDELPDYIKAAELLTQLGRVGEKLRMMMIQREK